MSSTYPGGKMRLYQHLINLIPPHQTYVATHAGHDAIAQMKRPAHTNILIDTDPQVIDWWRARADTATSDGVAGGIAISDDTRCFVLEDIAIGDDARSGALENVDLSTIANDDDSHRCPSLDLAVLASTIRSSDSGRHRQIWRFYQVDATRWLDQYECHGFEFVYADAPYILETRSSQREIYATEMTTAAEHEQLLKRLIKLPCPVMISHYHHPLYMDYLGGWHWRTFRAYDRAGNEKTEYVWMNYPEPAELHDYRYLGDDYRERERIKRKKQRWAHNWQRMDRLERLAILAAIEEANEQKDLPIERSKGS